MAKWKRNLSLCKRWQKNHLINKYGNICYLCGEQMATKKDMTIDHYLPFSKGGFDELSNYRLAHFHCNQLKADITQEEFIQFQRSGKLV